MRWDHQTQGMLTGLFAFSVLLAVLFLVPYAGYFRRFGRTLGLMLVALMLGDAIMISQFAKWTRSAGQFNRPSYGDPTKAFDVFIPFLAILLTVIFTMPLVVNFLDQVDALRNGGKAQEGEKPSHAPQRGRPWLSGWNLFWAGGAALFAWIGFQDSLWIILLACFAALAVGSAIFTAPPVSASAPAEAQLQLQTPAAEDLTAERARVLRLLEEGKINAEECGELLTALAESARGPAPRPASPARKLVIAGAALVFIGFMLPWFTINLGEVMKDLQEKVMGSMGNALPGSVSVTPNMMPKNIRTIMPDLNGGVGTNGTIRIQGADVAHDLGWMVLGWAIAAAVLPLFAVAMPPATRRKYAMLMLFFGSWILISIMLQNMRFAAVGIWLVTAGYVLEWLGVARESPAR